MIEKEFKTVGEGKENDPKRIQNSRKNKKNDQKRIHNSWQSKKKDKKSKQLAK